MAHAPHDPHARFRESERGFTLATVITMLTVLAVVLAYTVPKMWSDVMKRERELQTVFVMKQYARAIAEFQRKHGGYPTSIDQLEKENTPRVLRKLWLNPLSGEMDWILVPPSAAAQTGGAVAPGGGAAGGGTGVDPRIGFPGGPGNPTPTPATGGTTSPIAGASPDGGDPASYSGPFIGVRPPQKGEAFISLNDKSRYEEWVYTVVDLQNEINPQPQQPGQPGQQPGRGNPGNPQTPPTGT